MSSSHEPHAATDEESAPLIDHAHEHHTGNERQSLLERFSTLTQEPLTPLTKILLSASLVLLILASVFLGLFVGVEHRLASRNPESPDAGKTFTTTVLSTTSQIITAQPPKQTHPSQDSPCLDPDCITLSASILNSLDVTQDPCEDFYQFANGGWLKANPLPADKGSYGTFNELAVQNQRVIQQVLAKNATSYESPDSQTLTKLQDLYQSCLDEAHLESVGMKPLKDVVDIVKSLFNESSTSVESSHSGQRMFTSESRQGLTAAVAYLHSRGIDSLFQFSVEGDSGVDPNQMALWFYQGGLGLPSKEYYEDESTFKTYKATLTRIFSVLDEDQHGSAARQRKFKPWPPFPWPPWGDDDDDGGDGGGSKKKPKTAKELASAVAIFERGLARASLDLDRLQQDPFGTYNPTSFKNFSDSVPEFDFPTYWSTFAPRSFPEKVIVTYPAYLKSLSTLLSNTTTDVIEGYLVSRTSLSLAENLDTGTEIWKANRELTEILTGIKKGAVGDRAEFCSSKIESALGFAAGRFFVQETFGGESQSKAERVIKDIVEAFKRSLANLVWMDQTSAKAAAKKASNIRIKIGFPLSPNTTDANSIANYYSRVKIDSSDFFGNMLRASAGSSTMEWGKLGKRRNPGTWEMVPSTVNAYFSPAANEIVFPAGILRPPFFSAQWPGYLSYGAFGMVAAHELTHAFDSAGRLYDQEGKLRVWWTNATSEAFEERKICISRQYSNFTVPDGKGGHVHINGNLTSGENIGDQGLIQTYRAWENQYEGSLHVGNEYLLPGLNYTREQLFFIAFGRSWAMNMRPETAVQRIRSDPHSPNYWRVMGTLANTPQFAAAFNCPKGSKLNPPEEKQCRLW